jgi:hypothetical protein
MNDIQLVADKIVQHQGAVLRVMKVENDGVPLSNWLAEPENEKPGRIRFGIGYREISGGNCYPCDRLLFSGVRILNNDSSPKRDRLSFLPADECHDASSKQDGDNYSNPSLDFVSTSHLNVIIIRFGRYYDEDSASNVPSKYSNGRRRACIIYCVAHIMKEMSGLCFVHKWH